MFILTVDRRRTKVLQHSLSRLHGTLLDHCGEAKPAMPDRNVFVQVIVELGRYLESIGR